MSTQKESASYSTFAATLQGQPAEEEKKKEKKKGKKSLCLCGEIHQFKDCPYLIESNWPKD